MFHIWRKEMSKGKRILICLAVYVLFATPVVYSKTMSYSKVGFMDFDTVLTTYTEKFLELGIRIIEDAVLKLENDYAREFGKYTEGERNTAWIRIQERKAELERYRACMQVWKISGEIEDDSILEMVQRDIMTAIKKTSVLEGFSLILDKTGNFIYGNEEADITNRVLFKLDEKLLNLQNNELDDLLLF
jgi:Skp family chaperone for outer membrane proteins